MVRHGHGATFSFPLLLHYPVTTSALALELLWSPLEPSFAEQQRSAATATGNSNDNGDSSNFPR